MKTVKNWKLSILMLCLFLIVTFMFPSSALAAGIIGGDTVKKGEVLDQSLVLTGQSVVMDGVINGDLLAIGNEVTINGEVNGSLTVIGKSVILNGPVAGSAYVSALNLVLEPQASIGRDVYFIGNSLKTQDGATINRDLNVISLESDLSGVVNRQVNALVGPLNLIQKLYQFLINKGWLTKPLLINPPSIQDGFEKQASLGMAFGLPSIKNLMRVSSPHTGISALNAGPSLQTTQQAGTIDVERLKSWAVPLLRNLITLLILGLLIAWLVPAQLSVAREQARTSSWRALLTGLLVFVLGWFAALLVFVLILALTIFLYWISLPTLGFFVGAFGFMGLGLALSIFWLSIAYFSKIIIAALVGTLLFKRLLPKYAHSRVWPLVTGVILYALLASIPYLGLLVAVVTTLLGLGALWMLINMRQLPEGQSEAQPQPADNTLPVDATQPANTNQEVNTVAEG